MKYIIIAAVVALIAIGCTKPNLPQAAPNPTAIVNDPSMDAQDWQEHNDICDIAFQAGIDYCPGVGINGAADPVTEGECADIPGAGAGGLTLTVCNEGDGQ